MSRAPHLLGIPLPVRGCWMQSHGTTFMTPPPLFPPPLRPTITTTSMQVSLYHLAVSWLHAMLKATPPSPSKAREFSRVCSSDTVGWHHGRGGWHHGKGGTPPPPNNTHTASHHNNSTQPHITDHAVDKSCPPPLTLNLTAPTLELQWAAPPPPPHTHTHTTLGQAPPPPSPTPRRLHARALPRMLNLGVT